MEKISLSPSKLNDFVRCPRCFHDAYASKASRPRGIFPSLPGGMDLIMKEYVDQFRGQLPPSLIDRVPGMLFPNEVQMMKWRNWRTGPTWVDNVNNITLIGALDDCLVDGEDHIPLDWKTKGSEPDSDGSEYYQLQMDCYNLMLEYNGKQVRDEAWLVYIYPHSCRDADQHFSSIDVTFGMKPYLLKCDRERARKTVLAAADCLRGERPAFNEACEWCVWNKTITALGKGVVDVSKN